MPLCNVISNLDFDLLLFVLDCVLLRHFYAQISN